MYKFWVRWIIVLNWILKAILMNQVNYYVQQKIQKWVNWKPNVFMCGIKFGTVWLKKNKYISVMETLKA